MRKYVKKKRVVEDEFCEELRCDLCGAKAKRQNSWGDGWYDVNETEVSVTVKQREGESYPEGGSGTEYEVDICPECFRTKLVPWLISQGAKIQEKDWDY